MHREIHSEDSGDDTDEEQEETEDLNPGIPDLYPSMNR